MQVTYTEAKVEGFVPVQLTVSIESEKDLLSLLALASIDRPECLEVVQRISKDSAYKAMSYGTKPDVDDVYDASLNLFNCLSDVLEAKLKCGEIK